MSPLNSSSRRFNLALRFGALIVVALVFSKIAPTLAEENSPAPEVPVASSAPAPTADPTQSASSEPTPTDSATPAPTLSPIPSDPTPTPNAPVPSSSSTSGSSSTASPSPSPTPTVLPVSAQNFKLNIPASLNLDPRATRLYFPPINVASSGLVLACITSNKLMLDVYARGVADSGFGGEVMVSGDLTHAVSITGSADQVAAIINGGGGLATYSLTGSAAGAEVAWRFVAISMPTLRADFCTQGQPKNARTTQLRPLGLTLDLKKGDIKLKR